MSQNPTASDGSKSGFAISSGWKRKSQTTACRCGPVRPEGERGDMVGGEAEHQVGIDELALVPLLLLGAQARERAAIGGAAGGEGPGSLAMGDPALPVELRPTSLSEGRHKLHQLGMDRAAVVALVVVLHDRLPVGGHRIDETDRSPEIGQRVVGEVGLRFLELVAEGCRSLRIEMDPDETGPGLNSDVVEGQIFLVQAIALVEEWCRPEAAVEAVGPGVIGALDRPFERVRRPQFDLARFSGGVGQLRPAMPAEVDVGGEVIVAGPGDDAPIHPPRRTPGGRPGSGISSSRPTQNHWRSKTRDTSLAYQSAST